MKRKEALEVMNILRFGTYGEIINTHEFINDALDVAIEALKEERPHGGWIKRHYINGTKSFDMYVCSTCVEEFSYDAETGISMADYKFCPNCGADMRVKNELNRVTKELNSEIEKSKSEIVPDYRDGWRLREGEAE